MSEKQNEEDVRKILEHIENQQAINSGKADKTSFTNRDLGIQRIVEVEQQRDGGICGEDIQKSVDKAGASAEFNQDQSQRRAKEYVFRVLSKGYYDYLLLRKKLGLTKESITISKLRGGYHFSPCVSLINPGGLVWVKEGDYPLSIEVLVQTKEVEISCAPATVLRATAAINLVRFYWTTHVVAGLKNATLDLNHTALTGLLLQDSWHTINDGLKIINVGTNGVGVKIYSTDNGMLCLSNYVRCRQIKAYSSQIAGSIGVLIDSAGGINPGTNNVVDVGYIGAPSVETGIKNVVGDQSVFMGIVEGCVTGADIIGGFGHILSLHEEASTTYGIRIRTGASASGITRYMEKLSVEGTGKFLYMTYTNMELLSAYPNSTPPINFVVGNNYSISMYGRGDGEQVEIKENVGGHRRVSIAAPQATTGAGHFKIYRGNDEYELGGLVGGSAGNRPVLKFWDVTANAYKYAYIDNGAWVIASSPPT